MSLAWLQNLGWAASGEATIRPSAAFNVRMAARSYGESATVGSRFALATTRVDPRTVAEGAQVKPRTAAENSQAKPRTVAEGVQIIPRTVGEKVVIREIGG